MRTQVKIKSASEPSIISERGRCLRCDFDELSLEDNAESGRRGVLYLFGRSLIDFAHCITLPAKIIVCNFRLAPNSSINRGPNKKRIEFLDIELELDEEHCKNGAIYLIEPESNEMPLGMEYTPLKNLVETPTQSIYAVIKTIDEPENRKMRLTLTDPSLGVDNSMTCFLASDSSVSLPRQAKVGDVLRFHRITARRQHGGVMQLFGRMGKSGLSWLLFDGRPGSDLTPQSSSVNFTLVDNDYETARVYRSWFSHNSRRRLAEVVPPLALVNENVSKLEDFRVKEYKNLLLQVVGVFESNRSTKPVIVRGWDGTKCPTKSVKVDPEVENLRIYSYEKEKCEAIGDYAIDVFVYDQHCEAARNLQCNQFVLFTNVHFAFMKAPDFYFALHGGPMGMQFGRCVKEINETDLAAVDLKQTLDDFVSKLPEDKRRHFRQGDDEPMENGDDDERGEANNDNQRRVASVSPNRRATDPRRGETSASSRNKVTNVSPTDARNKSPTRSSPRRKQNTLTAGSSPSIDLDQLRRPPLSRSSQQLRSRNVSFSSPPRGTANQDTGDSIYSQLSPIAMKRRTSPRTTVDVAVGTDVRRVLRGSELRVDSKTASTATIPKTKPKRKSPFFYDSTDKSSSSSSEESEDSYKPSKNKEPQNDGGRLLSLRNRKVKVTPAKSPKTRKSTEKKAKDVWVPKSSKKKRK